VRIPPITSKDQVPAKDHCWYVVRKGSTASWVGDHSQTTLWRFETVVKFRPKRSQGAHHPETDGTTVDFLGLTHVWGRSRNGSSLAGDVAG
jgi:hypothetical protein